MKPSVKAASTRLCCEITGHPVSTLPEPLLSAVTTACSTAAVPTVHTQNSERFPPAKDTLRLADRSLQVGYKYTVPNNTGSYVANIYHGKYAIKYEETAV